ncbi:hypothetical protein TNCV_3843861 [Trichonephila clavipes]|nr:hypothetical protein TNCV_3843861 [Trichonephila clavipes]
MVMSSELAVFLPSHRFESPGATKDPPIDRIVYVKSFEAHGPHISQNVKQLVTKRVFNKRLWHELCDTLRRLVGTAAPGIMIVQFRMKKLVIIGSIPITIDCNVVAFIVFEEGFHIRP